MAAKIIERVKKDEGPTLLHAAKANELIDAVNALQRMTISPDGAGSVTFSEHNVVIELTPPDEDDTEEPEPAVLYAVRDTPGGFELVVVSIPGATVSSV